MGDIIKDKLDGGPWADAIIDIIGDKLSGEAIDKIHDLIENNLQTHDVATFSVKEQLGKIVMGKIKDVIKQKLGEEIMDKIGGDLGNILKDGLTGEIFDEVVGGDCGQRIEDALKNADIGVKLKD